MIKYLRHSDIALRVAVNPFNWNWKPAFEHDKPTVIYPKRHTYFVGVLFLQLFIDVNDGTFDQNKLVSALRTPWDIIDIKDEDEREMGYSIPQVGTRGSDLE